MTITKHDIPIKGPWAIRIFALFAFAYILSYAFRSVNAVIAPELIADLEISNAQLGLLSAAYFIGFSAMQIPLGYTMDRFGVRRTESVLLVIACVGASFFAIAQGLPGLIAGRLLIGIGVSACLMGPFTAYRRWYAIGQQGQLASGMLVFGTAGALITTVPVQWALPFLGWRGIFLVMAALVGIACVGIRFGLPKFDDHPGKNNHVGEDTQTSLKFREIVFNSFFLRMLPLGFISYGGFLALQTLWIGPWMIQVGGFSSVQSAQILFVFNFVMLLGYAANAWLVPRINERGFKTLNYVKWWIAIGLVLQFFAIASASTYGWLLWILVALSATVLILGQSAVGTVFPATNAGLATTSYNLLIFVGAFVFQWGIGWGIDLAMAYGASKSDAFKQVFFTYLLLQLFAYLWFLYYPKPLKKHLDNS